MFRDAFISDKQCCNSDGSLADEQGVNGIDGMPGGGSKPQISFLKKILKPKDPDQQNTIHKFDQNA